MIQILDSTLREGEQTPGVYFSPETKLAIAKRGTPIDIENEWPAIVERCAISYRAYC